jgi:hypothetical protein
MIRRKTVSIVVIIGVALLLVLPLLNSYWESLPQASYKIGNEIKGFPVAEMSLTIWNAYTTNESVQGLPEEPFGVQHVILNVSIHNLVNRDLFF